METRRGDESANNEDNQSAVGCEEGPGGGQDGRAWKYAARGDASAVFLWTPGSC